MLLLFLTHRLSPPAAGSGGDGPPSRAFVLLSVPSGVGGRRRVLSTASTSSRVAAAMHDEDMTPMLMSMRGARNGEEGVQQGFPSQEGGPRLIRFESPRWRPKATQVRAQFGVQEQHTPKMTPRPHTECILDVLYMDGKII